MTKSRQIPANKKGARSDEKASISGSFSFYVVHLLGFSTFFLFDFEWKWLGLCTASYYLRMFGISGVYHRYFAHKSYKTSRTFAFLLSALGSTAAQKGSLWWAAYHRHHHRHSDQPEDIHSPTQRGLWWSHVGWIICKRYTSTPYELIKDFARHPEQRWLNRFWIVPPVLYAITLFLVFGLPGLFWGFFLSTTLLWHGTFLVNSFTHVWGSERYATNDTSRNSFLITLFTMGEGWHNNHHYYQASVNQGFYWWEIDPSLYILKVLSWFGLVWDLRKPAAKVYDRANQLTA